MIIPIKWKEMLTKRYSIIKCFGKEPWKSLTFKQIKKLSKNKSDNYVHTALKKLVKHKILNQDNIGNSIVYSLASNTFALSTIGYISEYESNNAKHIPLKNINKILEKIRTSFYVFLITGSYASKKQKKLSDLDIVIICDDSKNPSTIISQINLECETLLPSIHPYVFTESQFYEMLINKEENYGKETAKNNLIITGAEQYYRILMRAIEHGFNG